MVIEIIHLVFDLILGLAFVGVFYYNLKYLARESAAMPVQKTDKTSLETLQPRAAAIAKCMGAPIQKYEKAMLITKTFYSENDYVSYDFSAYDKAHIISMFHFSPNYNEESDWRIYPKLINACVFKEGWVSIDDCEGSGLCI